MISFPSEDGSIDNAGHADEAADVFAFPASFAQERLWITEQLHPGQSAYTMPIALRLDGPLDVTALTRSLQAVVARHEALRTTFLFLDDELLQTVAPELMIPLPVDDLSGESPIAETEIQARISAEIRQPFDLQHGPLLRLRLLRLSAIEHILVLSLHHLIADGWSINVLVREIEQLYPAACAAADLTLDDLSALLPQLPIQYADYALWEREHWTAERLEQARSYWRQQLADAPTVLELPTDHPRPAVQTFNGAHLSLVLSPEMSEQIVSFSQLLGVSVFMTLSTALAIVLSRYTGQHEVLLGTPVAERTRPETRQMIGLLINTLVLRCDLTGNPTVAQALQRMRNTSLAAYAHQDLPFRHVVDLVEIDRAAGRSPLFQVLFAWQNQPPLSFQLGDVAARVLPVESGAAQFDLTFNLSETADGIHGTIEYNTDLFAAATITRLVTHYQQLLQAMIADTTQHVSRLPLLTDAEQHQLLDTWRATAAAPSPSFQQLWQAQAARTPGALAVVADGAALTYGELDRRANQLAHYLQSQGVTAEAPVAVLLDRSPAWIVALLATLKTGGVYVPLAPSLPAVRLSFMLADAQPRLLLTRHALHERISTEVTAQIAVVDLDLAASSIAELPTTAPACTIQPENAAYLIYTSGSTGQPKGVLVTQQGLSNLAAYQSRDLDLGPDRRVLQFASLSFDASISEVAMALTTGATLVLAHEHARLPGRELQALLRDQAINVVTLPPTALAATPADHLPALKTVLAAGEACPAAVVACWAPGRRFVNAYGPSETSVCATFALCTVANQPPPIGRPLANVEVLVLDAALEPVPIGVAGELYIGGVGLARGYRGRPDLTAERFVPHPFAIEPGARLYRSGDQVRWRPDGQLAFLGRTDTQVKLRGFRIELGEIEQALRQHPAVQQAAVVVREYPSAAGDYPDTRLVAYVVGEQKNKEQRNKEQGDGTDPTLPPSPIAMGEGGAGGEGLSRELRTFLSERLPSYMVPSAIVIMDQLPSTPSGKLDRRALPLPHLGQPETSNYVAPRDSVETTLAQIWRAALGVERAGVHDDFFELGGHSLLVMQIVSRIRDTFAVDLPPRALFETPTIAGLAVTIEQALTYEQPFRLPPITRLDREEQLPLSFAQERLWITEQLNPGRSAYTMPAALRLDGPLDVAALHRSLQAVVARHKALRTSFQVLDGRVLQTVAPELAIPLPVDDLSGESPIAATEIQARISAEIRQPFDLQHGPLLRLRLLRLSAIEHILVLSLHHLIADGWSISVLVRELEQLYATAGAAADLTVADLSALLPPLPIQYADYALWERRHLTAAWLEPHRVYWQEQLADAPTALELPTDHPRPAAQTFNGAHLPIEFSPALSSAIVELSQREGVTVFMTLCTALATVLSRYTGQTEIVIGTPAAHRTHRETEELIGLFINTLVLRCDLTGDPTAAQALQRMRTTCLEAYAHQELPFAQVIELIQPERDPSRSPLFQVLMAWQNTPTMISDLADVAVTALPVESGTAQFDLTFNLGETADGISGTIEYNTDLFAAATIARLAAHYRQLLQAMLTDPHQHVSRLPLLTDAEQRQLLVDWNAATLDAPAVNGIHELVQAQVERTPAAIAIVAADRSITYADLNTRANRLAHYLRQQGIGTDAAEVCVGIAMEPSIELIVGLLAILKAGAAYVPLDPNYPAERFRALCGDRQIALLLTQPHLLPTLPTVDVPILPLDPQADQLRSWPSTNPEASRSADNLAYVIYTSGSTGQPKGVMVTHRGVINNLRWRQQTWPLSTADRVLLNYSISFDPSVWSIFWPLSAGAGVVLVPPDVRADSTALVRTIAEQQISVFGASPSQHAVLVEEPGITSCSSLRYIVSGGEVLPGAIQQRWLSQSTATLCNCYGPTEATIDATYWVCPRVDEPQAALIGRPLPNVQVYVLDPQLAPVPIGVAGELYIGGVGLARGYRDRPDLTAERFVPHPFSPTPGARLYRSGDQVRWQPNGQLEFLGRHDQQVKLRGFRIELGEIEQALRQHPAVREAVVVTYGARGDMRLVAYVVGENQEPRTQNQGNESEAGSRFWVLGSSLREFLAQRLPKYMVPSAFVVLDALPLTPGGKLDRQALPAPDGQSTALEATFVAPQSDTERTLAAIWQAVLHVERIGRHDDFFELGGHSLLVMQVVSRIRDAFGVDLSLRSLFETPTIAGLALTIEQALQQSQRLSLPAIEPVGRDQPLPLSFAQERLWFVEQLDTTVSAYVMSTVLSLRGPLAVATLEQSINLLVERHESLRTTFAVSQDGPLQVISPAWPLPLRLIDLPPDSTAAEVQQQIIAELHAPFDLTIGPLLRATLLRQAADEHILVLALHHLIADGWSLTVFVRELATLYARNQAAPQPVSALLPPLPIQYADFAAWQRGTAQQAIHAQQLAYWREQLASAVPLELPIDYPRPPVQTFRGSQLPLRIDAATTAALHALSRRHDASLFMTLLAAFDVLLHRYSGQSDILVGTPVSNRGRRETEGLIGLLLNMLVLRADVSDDPRFDELLARVREVCLHAYANQDLPFERVVDAIQPVRDLSRNPLFQVAFFWQNVPAVLPTLAGVEVEALPAATDTAQFELTLNLSEADGGIQGFVEYNTDLFAATTVERLIRHYVTLLQAIVADPAQHISRLPLLTAAEQETLLRTWNATALPSPDACIHELIAAQAARTPDTIALVHEANTLTYAELWGRAARVAARLRDCGVTPDTRVGICLPRMPDLVVALLATLQAGGCYVPLDPTYPQERIQFMLEDAQAAVVLTTSDLQSTLGPTNAQIVCLDAGDWPEAAHVAPASAVTLDNLAYIIYTSGSTGRPKGVMVAHRNLANFVAGMDQRLGAEPPGTWLALTSVSFDISVLELLWTLARGFKVVLQDERSHMLPAGETSRAVATKPIDFSLFYFASASSADGDIYRLLLSGAQFADEHGFTAVWTPERHFHTFGGLYPNPSVMSAALATMTKRIQIRAGSVVLPLHNPIRVAEEWAIVDNLSRGRVGVSFASGWHADDFVFAPEHYTDRKQAMLDGIETVRRLWRGEAQPFTGGAGNPVQISILPRPIQPELPVWLTAAGNPETFRIAGEIGASLLTHLLGQSVEELAEKIAIYRRAWSEAGHAGSGHVTLMVHTFVGDDLATVRAVVREPFRDYLRNSVDLLDQLAHSLGLDMRAEQFTAADMDSLLDHAFERYFETSGLFGTPDTCLRQINRLKASGVDEVACLIDFGVATDAVLDSLPRLDDLRRRSNPAAGPEQIDYSLPAQLVRHQVTHVQCTPSQARMLLSDPEQPAAWQSVRALLLGGEALPVDLARQLREQLSADLYNMYGPTETTIWSTSHHVATIDGGVPLGRPIANTEIYILDRQLQPVPVGVAGDLYIGGAGVVRGYLSRPALTAERFIPDPFGQIPGSRLYKTGDRACYQADGVIEFLGRSDQQLKLRGYRIEPGEIEAALMQHPEIQQAAVIARADDGTEPRLVAYLVPSEPVAAPLKPVLSPDEQAQLLSGRSIYTMPNGMPIVHFGDLQVSNGYREVIEEAIYLRYGIHIPPAACIFDVGANIGFFSLFASQQRPDASIYAFEPIPPTFEALRSNVALYGLNVRTFPVGVAARRETANFTFYPSMPGISGRYADLEQDKLATKAIILNDRGYTSANQADPSLAEAEIDAILDLQFHSESYTCELRPLSEIIAEHGVTQIDLLKIDVERAEVDVLHGLREEDWPKIKQVVLEVDTRENLAAIVALLEQHGFNLIVDDFVVVPPDERQPGVFIYMVYASREPLRPDLNHKPIGKPALPASELREFLTSRLPEYMIPATFVTLPALPLTPNGKLDRKALPEPSVSRPELAVNYVAPRNDLEQRIAAVWQELLQLEQLGIHDNFFELGGTSLLLVQARTRLRAALDRDLSLVELFQYPTISALAQHLSAMQHQQPASAAMDKVRQQAERQKQARQQKRNLRRSTS